MTLTALRDLLYAAEHLHEWVKAVPQDTPLPAMPGCDGDFIQGAIENARAILAARPVPAGEAVGVVASFGPKTDPHAKWGRLTNAEHLKAGDALYAAQPAPVAVEPAQDAIREAWNTLLLAAEAVPYGALKNKYISAANGLKKIMAKAEPVAAAVPDISDGYAWSLIHKDFPYAQSREGPLLSFGEIKVVLGRALAASPAHPPQAGVSKPHIATAPSRVGWVYLAGPMTGIADYNFPAFNAAAAKLEAEGLRVVNPADHGAQDGVEWADYLRYDLTKIAGCESIALLPGWSASKGARLELHIAQALGMAVRYLDGAEASPPPQAGQEGGAA